MDNSLFEKGNYFKGRIIRIEPTLEVVFVDYGAERAGFLFLLLWLLSGLRWLPVMFQAN